jgi:hypothetical protein
MRFSSRQNIFVFQELVEEIDIPATQFLFEKDVLLFQELVKETNVPRGNTETKCDITSQDNIYIYIYSGLHISNIL